MKRIALVACAARKAAAPAPARDLYTSALFRLARGWSEKHADGWYILSAKHGLVAPETILEPYDVSLASLPCYGRTMWTAGTARQIAAVVTEPTELIFLASAQYRRDLVTSLQCHVGPIARIRTPLAGLGIGRQMAWLKAGGTR